MLGCLRPKIASAMLTSLLYSENFTLNSRALILETISAIATSMSRRSPSGDVVPFPGQAKKEDKQPKQQQAQEDTHNARVPIEQTAKQIIAARLAKKTRRFASGRRHQQQPGVSYCVTSSSSCALLTHVQRSMRLLLWRLTSSFRSSTTLTSRSAHSSSS